MSLYTRNIVLLLSCIFFSCTMMHIFGMEFQSMHRVFPMPSLRTNIPAPFNVNSNNNELVLRRYLDERTSCIDNCVDLCCVEHDLRNKFFLNVVVTFFLLKFFPCSKIAMLL